MSPGFVKTEIFEDDVYENNKYLQPEDVSNAILFVLGTPEHVQVNDAHNSLLFLCALITFLSFIGT